MSFQNQTLKFHSDAVGDDTLYVTELGGYEEISGLFNFVIGLVSTDPKLDLEKILYAPAKLGLLQHLGGDLKTFKYWAGMLESFEELERGQEWVRYRAVLVPDMAKLGAFYRSRIFMDQSVQDMTSKVLEDAGLGSGTDYEFALTASYPTREYAVQYEESDLAFVQRWLEHEGVFFFFENDGTNEVLRFGDETGSYKPVNPQGSKYPYRPEGAAQAAESATTDEGELQEEEIQAFQAKVTRLPAKVTLNDYNWRDPSSRLTTTKDVSDKGVGLLNEYNDHFKNDSEGQALATVRVQELTCRAKQFTGTGTCRSFRAGKTFELYDHFRQDFNATYLLTAVSHTATQAISLAAGTVTGATYTNTFIAIPATLVFRPERKTEWPSIKGVMNARVDSGGDGAAADLDDMGRYKIKIPFDEAMDDTPDGEASRYVRMAQPYAGVNSGMHFPLLKGTEVLLTHIDGDPDRPIISGSVPNPETVSPVDSSNASQNRIQTTSGNMMLMDDDADANGFVMASGNGAFIQDFRLPGGGSGIGTGIGGADTPAARARVPVTRADAPPPATTTAATAGDTAVEVPAGTDPLSLLPEKLRRKLFGPGQGGQVEGRSTSLAEAQNRASVIADGVSRIGQGCSLDGDYFLDSQIYPKKLEFRIGEVVKISQGAKFYHFNDLGDVITMGTGGNLHHTEQGDSVEVTIINGAVKSTTTHNGNLETTETRLGLKKTFEMTADIADVKSITTGDKNEFSLRSASDQTLTIALGQKGDIELDLGANVMKLEVSAGIRHTMKLNAATETEFLAGGPTTNVHITPKKDEVDLTWRQWLGLKEDQTALQKTDTALSKTDTQVQQTETTVQNTETAVQNTETKVQQTTTQVQETQTSVQETKTKVQETDTKVQSTETSAQNTNTTLQNTETQALRTSTSGATMIN